MRAGTAEMDFKEMQANLSKAGYTERKVTFSSKKATVLGGLSVLPLVAVFAVIYRIALVGRAHLTELTGPSFYFTLVPIIIVSIVVHEFLHGIGWALSSEKGWSVVRFNINALMPSCACKVALSRGKYLFGVLLPFIVLGGGSIIFLFVYPGTISILTMAVNIVLAGADVLIAAKVLREKNVLIADHPTEAGYIAFYKSNNA